MKQRHPKLTPEWLRRRRVRLMRAQFVRDYGRAEMELVAPQYVARRREIVACVTFVEQRWLH